MCWTHGRASTGPKPQQGQERCARANTIHGRVTPKIRRKRTDKLRELLVLKGVMLVLGMRSRTLPVPYAAQCVTGQVNDLSERKGLS
jgi:hypothetical protein